MAGSQITTSVTIIDSLYGFQGVSLTALDTASVPSIAAGSKVEIAGAFFTFNADETINVTSWSTIATGSTGYIALTPAGTAGSQTVTASWVSTAPEWSTAKQGYYVTAGSNVRVIGGCIKAGVVGSEYPNKFLLSQRKDKSIVKYITLASSGTYVVPANVYKIEVELVGGGGGGGGVSIGSSTTIFQAFGGGGGGAGAYIKHTVSVLPGDSFAYSVGSAGSGGGAGGPAGGSGGTTVFGTLQAGGGLGGARGAIGTISYGGSGGSVIASGDFGSAGGQGMSGYTHILMDIGAGIGGGFNYLTPGGHGGSSVFGSGGSGGHESRAPENGRPFGSGGGGNARQAQPIGVSASGSGAAGAPGTILVKEIYF